MTVLKIITPGTDSRYTLTKSGKFLRCRLCGRLFSNETFSPKHLHYTIYCSVTGIGSGKPIEAMRSVGGAKEKRL